MSTGKQANKRKALLRRPAEQVELALPPPPGATEFVPLEPQWWQQRRFVVGLGCALLLLLALTIVARVASHRDRAAAAANEARLPAVLREAP